MAPGPLRVDDVDLEGLVLARNDVHPDGDWWFDTRTGRSLYLGVDDDTDLADLAVGVHVLIPVAPQPRSDVDDFFAEADSLGVSEATTGRLWDAYRGKGGLRRFREVVGRTDAADAWSAWTFAREAARAIDWLLERSLVDPDDARRARDALRGPDG